MQARRSIRARLRQLLARLSAPRNYIVARGDFGGRFFGVEAGGFVGVAGAGLAALFAELVEGAGVVSRTQVFVDAGVEGDSDRPDLQSCDG
jgi:hypothetical protein